MRRDDLPGGAHLTYCTNIHAGETWDDIRLSLDAHVPRIKALVSPDAPFGLGLRLSGIAAAELVEPPALDRFREQLDPSAPTCSRSTPFLTDPSTARG